LDFNEFEEVSNDDFPCESDQFRGFEKEVKELSGREIDDQIHKRMNVLVDITEETDYLKEIKDVSDELNSILSIIEKQGDVLKDLAAYRSLEYRPLLDVVKERKEGIEGLIEEAQHVYRAVIS
jgi:hypothetical protein